MDANRSSEAVTTASKGSGEVEQILRTMLAERGSIRADRFLTLLATVVTAWEEDVGERLSEHKRRTFSHGYARGQAKAFRDIARLLQCYQWVGEADTQRDTSVPKELATSSTVGITGNGVPGGTNP